MNLSPDEIIKKLESFVSEHKQRLVDQVTQNRIRHLTLVFEDIDKPHNISAVLRTAECLGLQDLHFIKNQNDYHVNKDITKGAAKWLTLHHHNSQIDGVKNIEDAYSQLKSNGYKIYATSLSRKSVNPTEIDTTEKIAIVFGTEGTGISTDAADRADGLVKIPMRGFTESFNLSVSAAIILNTLLRNESEKWSLTDEEKQELKAEWYRQIVREADKILALKR